MTAIAAKKDGNFITLAADSMVSSNNVKSLSEGVQVSKLIQHNGMIIGSSGRCYEGTLMEIFSQNHKPSKPERLSVIEFLMEFGDWVQRKDKNYKPENQFLIAFSGALYLVTGGLDVYEVNQYEAIGSGRDFVNAALYLGKTPKEAVEVACKLSVYCLEPVVEKRIEVNEHHPPS